MAKKEKKAKEESKASAKEVEELILELGRIGTPSNLIGQTLRDEHNIQNVKELTGKRITKILRDSNAAPKLPADVEALIKSAIAIKKHLAKHKQDVEARYGLNLTESKIRRLAKYYRRAKILPPDWKYESEAHT